MARSPSQAKRSTSRPLVIDLFAGAGVFGHAFERSGFSILSSYEMDPVACSSLAANSKGAVVQGDLQKIRPEGRCDVLIGGPPCQGFSSIGTRSDSDPRNNLALLMAEWAKATRPSWVVIENVPAFLASPAWKRLDARMRKLGYSGQVFKINARDLGAAQNRVRGVTIYNNEGKVLRLQTDFKRVSIHDAWNGLSEEERDPLHFAREPSSFALKRIRLIPEGGDVRDLFRVAPHLVPPSWLRTNGKVVDIWGRLCWSGVSNTIRTGFLHPSRGRFLHPEYDRPITFREAARLQTIPDEYVLLGGPQALARQIGNAVPLAIGSCLADAIRAAI